MQQGSNEWLAARLGVCTASRFKDVLKGKSGKYLASRRKYMIELIAEILTGAQPGFTNASMEHGSFYEEEARALYELETGCEVIETGLIIYADNSLIGASPDGLVASDGMIEIKCPNTTTHIESCLNGMNEAHMPQIQGNLWINGRDWCDFISYDPRMMSDKCLYIQRIPRDEEYIISLSSDVLSFVDEVEDLLFKFL